MLVPARLFVPIQVVVGEHAAELNGSRGCAARVQVNHNVHAVAAGLAHGFHAARRMLQGGGTLDQLRNRDGHGFHGCETRGDTLLHTRAEFIGLRRFVHAFQTAAAQVVIKTKSVAYRSAQKLAHRLAQFFTFDIPERLIDAADGGHIRDTAAPEVLPVHGLPEVLDAPRVLPDYQHGNVLNCAHDALGFPFERGFTPADQVRLIGFDPYEDPVAHARIYNHGRDLGDFHLRSNGKP